MGNQHIIGSMTQICYFYSSLCAFWFRAVFIVSLEPLYLQIRRFVAYNDVLDNWNQLCGNSWKVLTRLLWTKRALWRNHFLSLLWKNFTGLHRKFSHPKNQLQARPYRPTLVPNFINALAAEWEQIPAARFQHFVESFPRRITAIIAA